MAQNRVRLDAGGKTIVLIGTAHVSRESVDEVREAIREERPAAVCVELDEGRYRSLFQKDNWEKLDIVKVFRDGKGFLLLANLALSSFQRRMGDELGVKPGEEMRAACEEAQSLGIPYVFCDRQVQVTLRRAWRRCGLWSKAKLLSGLLASVFTTEKLDEASVEELKKESALGGMMSELAGYLPEVKETLIDERDRYLAAKIWQAGGSKVVAVVGAGHMGGIKTNLEKIAAGEESADVSELDKIPPAGIGAKIAGWFIPVLLAAIIGYGIWKLGASTGIDMALRWLIWNGGLAALGTIAALGHPLSILVAFVGAPIATVNPFVGVGLFAGITEATVRKPRVEDAETVNEAVSSLKGIYRNRITRALLVFLLSSVGGMVGNFIGIPAMIGQLFK